MNFTFHKIRFLSLILTLTGYFFAGCGVTAPYNRSYLQRPEIEKTYGIPYRVNDQTYYPLKTVGHFTQDGIASWYGPKFHGKLTSNKEIYDMNAMTAAHKILPFDTHVRVINLENGRETVVRINDRGPFVNKRIIDLSYAAARSLGMTATGTASVRLTVLKSNVKNRPTFELKPEKYSIQIGVFKEESNARTLAQSVSESRTDAFVKEGNSFYRVLVGNYDQYDKAIRKLDALRLKGYPNSFIVAP